MRAGTPGVDLHGSEVGTVSHEDELRASARLKAAKTARAKAKALPIEGKVPHGPITPPLSAPAETEPAPARLGFEGLRKAERERETKRQVSDDNK